MRVLSCSGYVLCSPGQEGFPVRRTAGASQLVGHISSPKQSSQSSAGHNKKAEDHSSAFSCIRIAFYFFRARTALAFATMLAAVRPNRSLR